MRDHFKILILSVARPRRGAQSESTVPYDFCPRPIFVRLLVGLLRLLGYRFMTLSQALTAPAGKIACLTFDGTSRDIHRHLFPQLRALRIPATIFVPTKTIESRTPGLKWAHLRLFAKHGWEIGSLGHEPIDLSEHSHLAQRHSIARSRQLIRAKLGQAPALFAYPFGAYDATTVSCLREEGYAAAVTMRKGINAEAIDPYQLRRLALSSSTWRDLVRVCKYALTMSRPAMNPERLGPVSKELMPINASPISAVNTPLNLRHSRS